MNFEEQYEEVRTGTLEGFMSSQTDHLWTLQVYYYCGVNWSNFNTFS